MALVRLPVERYAARHPRPEDTYLVVEIADASLRTDRRRKIPMYARGGIAELWLVDLAAGRIEVHSRPSGARYATVRIASRGDMLAPDAFPDVPLRVADLLPD